MSADTVYGFTVKNAQDEDVALAAFKDKVLLIVNVASRCGFTPQYEGLQALHRRFGERGLLVLGFPCNQFGAQEPGDNAAIQDFCRTNYGVSFPVFGKLEVNGRNEHPLYAYLKTKLPGLLGTEAIKWNFTKFLVGRNGEVVKRYAPQTTPAALEADIEKALAGPA
jgi:glutathione peroxidase